MRYQYDRRSIERNSIPILIIERDSPFIHRRKNFAKLSSSYGKRLVFEKLVHFMRDVKRSFRCLRISLEKDVLEHSLYDCALKYKQAHGSLLLSRSYKRCVRTTRLPLCSLIILCNDYSTSFMLSSCLLYVTIHV